jgi:hypothetical protein
MNAEARVLAEPAEGSTGARLVARRILVATVLGFAMLVVLGGTSRADPLEPVEGATETVSDTVSPVVETVTDTVSPVVVQTASDVADPVVETVTEPVSPVVQTASDVVDPVVQTVTDTVDPIVDILGPVRGSIDVILPRPKGSGVRLDPPDPRSPPPRSQVERVTPPTSGAPPVSVRDPLARSMRPIAGSAAMPSIGMVPLPPSAVLTGTALDPALSPGIAHGRGADRWPVAPFGNGVTGASLALLAAFAALAVSLAIRPPPLTTSLVPRIVPPNGAALALSVERPG